MFTPTIHPYVSTEMAYSPQGYMPYQPPMEWGTPGNGAILYAGETVTVISAWERDYLPGSPKLLWVQSHNTGERTHVIADDLKAITRAATGTFRTLTSDGEHIEDKSGSFTADEFRAYVEAQCTEQHDYVNAYTICQWIAPDTDGTLWAEGTYNGITWFAGSPA